MKIINVDLISNPLNWVVVIAFLFIGGFAVDLALTQFNQSPTPSNS